MIANARTRFIKKSRAVPRRRSAVNEPEEVMNTAPAAPVWQCVPSPGGSLRMLCHTGA